MASFSIRNALPDLILFGLGALAALLLSQWLPWVGVAAFSLYALLLVLDGMRLGFTLVRRSRVPRWLRLHLRSGSTPEQLVQWVALAVYTFALYRFALPEI
jgi:hypothetical protein